MVLSEFLKCRQNSTDESKISYTFPRIADETTQETMDEKTDKKDDRSINVAQLVFGNIIKLRFTPNHIFNLYLNKQIKSQSG